jgi:hypothetical protein
MSDKITVISPELQAFLLHDVGSYPNPTARKIGISVDTLSAVLKTGTATKRVAKACEQYFKRVTIFVKHNARQAARRSIMESIFG